MVLYGHLTCYYISKQTTHMKIFPLLAAAVLAAVTPLSAAKASNFEEHQMLYFTVERAGVPVVLNHPELCDEWGGGSYRWNEGKAILVICQDNGSRVGFGNQVVWTENDLDTLRHEAHHIVQDCSAGVIADGISVPYFKTANAFQEFVKSSLSIDQVRSIWAAYSEKDVQDDVKVKEVEAFAVAATVSPRAIADAIVNECL